MNRIRRLTLGASVLALAALIGCTASNVPMVTITTTALPNGVVNTPYSQILQGSHTDGGWFIVDGNLPPGLTLSQNGVISGTPTTAGSYSFTVEADQNNSINSPAADQILVIVITAS